MIFVETFIDIFGNNPFYHFVLEVLLLVWVLWLVFRRNVKTNQIQLSLEETEQLIDEFTPEPLVPYFRKDHPKLKERIVNGKVGKVIDIDGKSCINFATHNYIGFIEDKTIEKAAVACVRKYGVGSCGPPQFFGTLDVHLELEERLARYMQVEATLVYSYGFCTITSAISAYTKRGDIIFADECVNFAIQKALEASAWKRCRIIYFKHNDVKHLEELLENQAQLDTKNPKMALKTRRFLIVEGIYNKTGQICPLPDLIKLCKRFKLRIFIDESISVGCLGKHGRGVTEYFNVPVEDVDLIMGSLENSLATIGGFCAGSSFIVDHQNLYGAGYYFSSSLPSLIAAAAVETLNKIEARPEIFQDLFDRCCWIQESILNNDNICKVLTLNGHLNSPVKHLRLTDPGSLSSEQQLEVLDKICDYCVNHGFAIITASYLTSIEIMLTAPSIRLIISTLLSKENINRFVEVLEDACIMCHI